MSIAEAVAGFVADVGMHEPSPQETFADQARLLHHARRGDIIHVSGGNAAAALDATDVDRLFEPLE